MTQTRPSAGTESPQSRQKRCHQPENPRADGIARQRTGRHWRGENDMEPRGSFGSLRDSDRAKHTVRPVGSVWPVGREPLHGTLENTGEDVTAFGDIVELGATVQHECGDALAANAAVCAIDIGNQKNLLSHVHDAQNADKKPHCQQRNVRVPFSSFADDNPRMKNDLHERIRQRLNDLNMSEEAASKAMGSDRSYLRKLLERPASSPRGETLRKLAATLQCSEAWLLTGEGEPTVATATVNVSAPPAAFANTARSEVAGLDRAIDVPVMGTAAGSLARGAFQLEGGIVDYVRRPHALAGAKDIYALYVEGSSMEPQYFAGDLIYVHPHRPARPGDIVVVQSRMEKHSDNEASLGIYMRRTEKTLVLGKRNPVGSEIELNREYITAVHKVLSVNELFGL